MFSQLTGHLAGVLSSCIHIGTRRSSSLTVPICRNVSAGKWRVLYVCESTSDVYTKQVLKIRGILVQNLDKKRTPANAGVLS